MTDPHSSDDTGTPSIPTELATDALAGVHQQLAVAGISLNEAQTHLSAIRTVTSGPEASPDVLKTELETFVEVLRETRS
jgi:hypothetical protein